MIEHQAGDLEVRGLIFSLETWHLISQGTHYKFVFTYQFDLKIKSVAYSSEGSYIGQLDFWKWQIAVRRDNVISITLRQV